ncbi:MAG: hypothetical protein IKB74_06890 [Lentisphaeria bacterium]|nr:hypothetical protein [Lentisphaeria bacterium]
MQSKTGIFLLTAFFFLFALFVNGCSAPSAEQQNRLQLYSLLDEPAAERLSVTGQSALKWKSRQVELSLERKIESASNPAERRHFAAVLSLFKLFTALCPPESVSGMGHAAYAVDDKRVYEKGVLLLTPESKGLLKDFFNPQDTLDIKALYGDVPAQTAAFFAADIRVTELWKTLGECGGFSEILAAKLPAGIPVAEFVSAMDGVWQLTLLQADKKHTVIKISVPDKESLIFNMFSMAAHAPSGGTRLFLPGFGTFIRQDGRLTLYLGAPAEEIFKAAEKDKLTFDDRIMAQMPEKAAFFAFADPRKINDDLKNISLGRLSFAAVAGMEEPVVLAVSHLAEEYGYLISANGGGGILSPDIELFNDIILPLFKDCLPDKNQLSPSKTVKKVRLSQQRCSCAALLAQAAKAVKDQPELEGGFYRIEEGKMIPAEAAGFEVVLFKSKTPSRSLPIVIAPAHKEGFCACGLDGKVSRYQLVKPDSFRRIAGFLHTVYKFDEKVFRELVTLAGELDRKQGK